MHIHDKKARPQANKMLAKAMTGKLCGYEGQSGKVYRIRLDNTRRIVRARDARFIEDFQAKDEDREDPIHEATFEDAYISDSFDASVWLKHLEAAPKKVHWSDQSPTDITAKDITGKVDNKTVAESGLLTPEATPEPDNHDDDGATADDDDSFITADEDEEQAADLASDNIFATVRPSRRTLPPGYYKTLHNKGKGAADRLVNGSFVDLDQFEEEARQEGLAWQWVFDQKFDANGQWVSNRARWVVCGNFENGDHSPHEVFSAVPYASSIRIFFNMVATLDLHCHQFDIVGAFLNAVVPKDTEVYVQKPTGFEDGTGRVCRLIKALYGLARSPLWWFKTFVPKLEELGFKSLTSEGCIFTNPTSGGLLLMYVDDLRVAANNIEDINKTVDSIAGIFELKRMGEAPTFLGYSVRRDRENRIIYLSQHLFVEKIIERFNKQGLNPAKTPWIPGKFVLPKTWETVEGSTKGYQTEIGSINYLANGTRPDISYTMMRLGEANVGPSSEHLQLLHHLWRYITGTKMLAIRCGGKIDPRDLHLRAFGDASFASDLMTRASVGGHVVLINNCPVVWKARKQVLVTLSSTEAEFINLTPTAMSLLWVATVLKDMGYHQKTPLLMFTDSANARAIALNPLNTARTYHIDLRHKWVIQRLSMGEFVLDHVGTEDMVADGFTKPFNAVKHAKFVRQLGLVVVPNEE